MAAIFDVRDEIEARPDGRTFVPDLLAIAEAAEMQKRTTGIAEPTCSRRGVFGACTMAVQMLVAG